MPIDDPLRLFFWSLAVVSLGALVLVIGVGLGMLAARRLSRWAMREDEDEERGDGRDDD